MVALRVGTRKMRFRLKFRAGCAAAFASIGKSKWCNGNRLGCAVRVRGGACSYGQQDIATFGRFEVLWMNHDEEAKCDAPEFFIL